MDPFTGLGSTAVACARLGVNFVGADIDETYLRRGDRGRGRPRWRRPKMAKRPARDATRTRSGGRLRRDGRLLLRRTDDGLRRRLEHVFLARTHGSAPLRVDLHFDLAAPLGRRPGFFE